MTAEREIAGLLRRYVRLQVDAAGDPREDIAQIVSRAYLARIEPVLDAGEADPLFGVQDMPDAWIDRITVIVQSETGSHATALALFGPPPDEPRGYKIVAVCDRHNRWRIDNVMDRE